MKLIPVTLLSIFLLTACGGGGEGGSNENNGSNGSNGNTGDKSSVTENIDGLWYIEYENCLETIQFDDDGTFRLDSGEFYAHGDYQFEQTVSAGDRHRLDLKLTQWNGGEDCIIEPGTIEREVTAHISFPNGMTMTWYEDEETESAVGSYTRDNPLQLDQTEITVTGEETIQLAIQGKFAPAVNPKLLYGPDGASLNEKGEVIWAAKTPLFGPQQFRLGVSSDDSLSSAELVLTVQPPQAKLPTTRVTPQINHRAHSIFVGDFVGNGKKQVLLSGAQRQLTILEYQGGDYRQIWSYPFDFETIYGDILVQTIDLDGDGKSEILLRNQEGIYLITDLNEPATLLLPLEDSAFGHFEIATHKDSSHSLVVGEGYKLQVWSLEELTLSHEFSVNSNGLFQLGDVVGDQQLEAVFANGQVYRLADGNLLWHHSEEFGKQLVLADASGNGRLDIIGAPDWGDIVIYDALQQSAVQTIPGYNNCGLQTADLTGNGDLEIVIGFCQAGTAKAFVKGTDGYSELWHKEDALRGRDIQSITVADSNSDGEQELLWGSDSKRLSIFKQISSPELAWSTGSSPKAESFMAAGWGQIRPGYEAAVFITPRSHFPITPDDPHSREGQRYIQMNEQGELTFSGPLGDSWDDLLAGKLADIDHDGFTELVFAHGENYDSQVLAHEVDSNTVRYSEPLSSYSKISHILLHDLNNDGFMDAIVAGEKTIRFIDIKNHVELGRYEFPDNISAIALQTVGEEIQIAVSLYYSNLMMLSGQSGSYRQSANLNNRTCEQLAFKGGQLICAQGSVIYRFDAGLSPISETDFRTVQLGDIRKIIPLEHGNLILAATLNEQYKIVEVNEAAQKVIWQSPPLLGRVLSDSMHLIKSEEGRHRLQIGTESAMYLTH
ncbi:FG-GAP repeat domain-containing protein [Ferrimonas marina]|uniref:FG-GAP repeat domain-containing protein n=1 Tax=Ferrimonas marina TaxID=299255 RepID=UPI000836672A|nr:VCBS repeat-containing protein [Ferrimonas marina]